LGAGGWIFSAETGRVEALNEQIQNPHLENHKDAARDRNPAVRVCA